MKVYAINWKTKISILSNLNKKLFSTWSTSQKLNLQFLKITYLQKKKKALYTLLKELIFSKIRKIKSSHVLLKLYSWISYPYDIVSIYIDDRSKKRIVVLVAYKYDAHVCRSPSHAMVDLLGCEL